jgi:outer membrane biosynthesis protein TonB/pSer/pThr/pTyr-binding forkhead associated (FHA) protein
MRHFELDIEHRYKNKFVGRYRLRPFDKALVLGHSKSADVRLMGEDVSPIHAYIEFQENEWRVLDAGSERGTWILKKPVIQEGIKEETVVTIGGHQLKLIPRVSELEVFSAKSLQERETTKPLLGITPEKFHQVIIRHKGVIKTTHLLELNEPFAFKHEGREHHLTLPKEGEIKTSSYGPYELTQRLVNSQALPMRLSDVTDSLRSPETRTSMLAAFVCLLVLGVVLFAIPHKPEEELADLKPDNKYNRMIFDAELVKKKRAEAKEMRKTIMASAPKAAQQQVQNTIATPVKSEGKQQRVVSKLKLQGLSALLGKISKRANAKGPSIVGFGKTADNTNTGTSTTVAAVGSLQNLPTGNVGNGGDVYKVGAVGTVGKGGGKGGRGLAGLGGLVSDGVGSGTVGIIDQETEIEGGLDKEVIAKAIGNYLGEIRYCYERQLSAEPDLYGKVQVKFTIDANGDVSEYRVGSTTLKSAMVEGCILRRLARWKFPKPKGGTHVLVTYPFMFKSTN